MKKIKIGEKEYEIHYGQNSVCALEDELQEPVSDFLERIEAGNVKFKDVRALIWAGLLKSDRTLTPEQLGDICDNAGVSFTKIFPEFTSELVESFKRFLPDEMPPDENFKKK